MAQNKTIYLQLTPGNDPPSLGHAPPFKAVIVVESEVTVEWRMKVSEWLIQSGCRYMMAWGKDCSLWDDSVDVAQLEMFDFGQIPDDGSTMTTWHEDETIEDVFWFAQFCASHDNFELSLTYILHVSDLNRQDEFLMLFEAAKDA